ncbi:MAG: hypothetical protein JWL73_3783 [Actinomycetia bacterium]|nr:hypothetical protein [Actinomycetes bacterium]
MRRISILLVAVVALTGLGLSAGAAGATTTKSSSTCGTLAKRFSGLSGIDASAAKNPKDLSKIFGNASNAFKAMAKKAPPKLKAPLNRLAKTYASLKSIDFTSATSIAKMESLTATIGKDSAAVSKYFATCKL